MAQKYGNTYWGKKWLEAFNGIDYSNRLPRGRSYANRGLVYDIKISGNKISAKVTGSRRYPYDVSLSLSGLSPNETDLVKNTILKSPSVLSQFLNRHLSETLHKRLEDKDIKLFPSSWKNISATCSCPDWAVPCKHIAAVIYLIANEIDKNPFLVFTLNDCDLLRLIDDINPTSVEKVQHIPQITQLLAEDTKNKNVGNLPLIDQIDLSQIPVLGERIVTLLPGNPPFYDKNFQELLSSAYSYWQRYGFHHEAPHEANESFSERWHQPEQWEAITIDISDPHQIASIRHKKGHCFPQRNDRLLGAQLVHFLSELPQDQLHSLSPEICYLHALFHFAQKLFNMGAIIPQILQDSAGYTYIRWLPALFEQAVEKTFSQLVDLCPPTLITFNKKNINHAERVKSLINLLLIEFMANNLPGPLIKQLGSPVVELFFARAAHTFTDFSTKEIPQTISLWLSRLHLFEKKHKLCLKVQEKKRDFQLSVEVIGESSKVPQKLKKALTTKNITLRLAILSDLSLLGEYIPGFNDALDNEEPLVLPLTEFSSFFLQVLPALQALGITIMLPKSLQKIIKPTLRLRLEIEEGVAADSEALIKIDQLLSFDWKIALGDKELSTSEFKKLLKQSRGLVKIMDTYVLLDEKEIKKLISAQQNSTSLSQPEILQALLSGEFHGAEVVTNEHLKAVLANITSYTPAVVPENLKATLRPYQERGFSWLIQNINIGFGSIIADDMGLGKTIQVITALLHCKNAGLLHKKKALIVAPTSLLSNWQHEIERFAPDLKTCVYHGQDRKFLNEFDVAITSYGLARRDTNVLKKMAWFILAIDEAQNIKNPTSAQSKAIKSIKASNKIAMSGTPVENRLLEYWSIFDFTNKHYLGTPKEFRMHFAQPIEQERDQKCLQHFRKITGPFMLRRLKSDKTIIKDLPDKIESNQYCSLSPEQTALYQEVVNLTMKKIESSEGIERKGLVFKLLTSLKQICNHPAQYSKTGLAAIDQSGKLEALIQLLTAVHDAGEKALIFTQYVEMGNLLAEVVQNQFSLEVPFLHGGLSRKKRDLLVREFQESSQIRTLIVSLKAGGTGLNLTAANHVIHYDLWWNPAVEAQATDRAYRIGQKKNVMVHRLLTTGTFEEQIDQMIQQKKELANLTVSSGENWISELSNEQLQDLVTLRHVEHIP